MSQTEVLQQNPSITLLYDKETHLKSEDVYLQEARFSYLSSVIRNAHVADESRIEPPEEYWDGIDSAIEISENLPLLHTGPASYHKLTGIHNAQAAALAMKPDAEQAFFVADLSHVYFQHQRWTRCLPGIKPFYGKFCSVSNFMKFD